MNRFLKIYNVLIITLCLVQYSIAQNSKPYWQQHVDYKMDIKVDVKDFTYQGTQQLVYTNNSPDTLEKVYYHLYFNAFQPGSEMDVRSRTISDPDSRVRDRIYKLNKNDIGFINVESLHQNGVALKYRVAGTVLEVLLDQTIGPGEQATFDMVFNAQIPQNIRRSGKNNNEGVALSMAQWFPKLAEYDFEGWHADPYIGREFHGVWGDFDVSITIDKSYVVAGTGYLQNPNEVGHGYETTTVSNTNETLLTWHFFAPNVHDFTWAADPDFIHNTRQVENGPKIHVFYKRSLSENYKKRWEKLPEIADQILTYFSETVGPYPYDQYSIIQGGDGGMEYGMCTLITAKRSFKSLVGVTAHEIAHSWFQFLLANNENKHAWMDEGFSDFTCAVIENKILEIETPTPYLAAYKRYINYALSGWEQSMSTNADRFRFNSSYGTSSYTKGTIFLAQLSYIIGQENLEKTLKLYFKRWAFKHPTPNDFIRCAEQVSGLELGWYLTDWTQTTNTIDYAIGSIKSSQGQTTIGLNRIGLMPMPIEVMVEFVNGEKQLYYIPLRMMRGEKPVGKNIILLEDWAWAYPNYYFSIENDNQKIKSITIDPEGYMADVNRVNNTKRVDN